MDQTLWHNFSWQEAVGKFGSDAAAGLSEAEAKDRQIKFGKNEIAEEKPESKLSIFLAQFKSSLIYILVIAGLITLFFRQFADTIVIFGAVILNTAVGYLQEDKASAALAELKKAVSIKARVLRGGNELEVNSADLVPGDIIILSAGDKVPADGRLIEARDLKINESSLTGEWIAAEKKTDVLPEDTPLADRDNMVYMSTVIEEGRGKAVVTETGQRTEIGKVAQALKETREEKTPYQKKIVRLSKVIGILIIAASLIIFVLGMLTGRDIFEMFLTAVAVAVAAIPEGLPVSITVILALGMQRILKKKGLVRKMVAAETLGSTSVILTDKTGTLTEAKMQVSGVFTGQKELLSDGSKYSEPIDLDGQASHLLALKIAVLCSEAFIENPQDPLEEWIVRGRPTDRALLLAGIQAGINKTELEKKEPKVDELPFDPIYKYAATLNKTPDGDYILNVLGAPEIVLEMSSSLDRDGAAEVLSEEKRRYLQEKYDQLAGQGQRVLATAYRQFPISNFQFPNIEDLCKDLTFVGLIALHDPLRKEAKETIEVCRRAGIRPVIVTGDHKLTTKAIAQKVGLPAREENIIEGRELEKLSDEELQKRIESIEIYARVESAQKLKIVEAWQARGEVVAMTGDGVNDAPALKRADIGVALGSGTDVAKEASDLILLSSNFSVIVAAIQEGRRIVDNIRKTVTLLLSQTFSEIVLIGASIIAGLPLPILPAQILWENLIEGSPQGVALAFEEKEKGIMERKPESARAPLLTAEMKTIIFGFAVFTSFILFGLFLWLLRQGMPLPEIRTIMFAVLSVDTFFYAFSCRNLRKNIWQYNPFSNRYLLAAMLFSVSLMLIVIYVPIFQNLLRTVPLNLFDWGFILGFGIINLVLIEAIKWYFISR